MKRRKPKIVKSAQMFCRRGAHDAVYLLAIVPVKGGFAVVAQHGRRLGMLTQTVVTKTAVGMWEAERVFAKQITDKTKPGRVRVYKLA